MASNAEMVAEFREIVDDAIERSAEKNESTALRSSRGGKNNTGTYRLNFFSIGAKDARFQYIPYSSEHVWAVGPSEKGQIQEYSGFLAIVSFANETDRLFRHWTFDSAMQMQHPSTSRAITGSTDIEEGIAWVRSPHLNTEAFERLAMLDEQELASLNAQFKTIDEQAATFRKGMQGANRMSRMPMPNIGPVAR